MKRGNKTEEQLIREVEVLKQRLAEMEKSKAAHEEIDGMITKLSLLKEKLIGTRSLNEKLKLITDGIVDIFDADFARIWMIRKGDLCDKGCIHADVTEGPHVCHDRDRCLHLMASSGRYTHIDGDHRRVPFGCYKIGKVASSEYPKFITNDVTHDPQVHDHKWAKSLGLASFAGYRLLSPDNEPIGVMALFKKQVIVTDEEKLLEDLANTTSHVIMVGKAEEELQKAHANLERRVEERTAELQQVNMKLKEEIIEREKAQQAIKKSEEKYRSIVEKFLKVSNEIIQDISKQ